MNFRTICANVVDYVPPSDDLVVYMYQPFREPVLRDVLASIRNALGDRHHVYLCYSNPYKDQDPILQNSYFQLLDYFPTFNIDNDWKLYGNAQAAGRYL